MSAGPGQTGAAAFSSQPAQPSQPSQPALAIIVVSYKVRELLSACLRATFDSLARTPWLQARVVVVENASGDGSAEMVAADFPQATLIVSDQNLGFSGGNNLALRSLGFGEGETTADRPPLVLLLNPDAEPQGDAIAAMAQFLMEHPPAGGAGARLQYPGGRFQHGAFAFPGLLQLWFDLFPPRPRRLLETRLNGRYPRARYDGATAFPIDFPLGAALMVRAEAIDAAGLMDEGYFMYAEEVDWCWRMRRAGWRFFCVPGARVVHHGGASARQFRGQSFVNLWRSRQRLYDRFYGPARRRLAHWIVRLGMVAERRKALRAAARGQVGDAELAERLQAVDRVLESFR